MKFNFRVEQRLVRLDEFLLKILRALPPVNVVNEHDSKGERRQVPVSLHLGDEVVLWLVARAHVAHQEKSDRARPQWKDRPLARLSRPVWFSLLRFERRRPADGKDDQEADKSCHDGQPPVGTALGIRSTIRFASMSRRTR